MKNHFTKGSLYQKSSSLMFLIVVLFVGLLQSFNGCDLLGVKSDDSLYGTWKAVGTQWVDGYKITYSSETGKAYIEYLGDYSGSSTDMNFKGEIQDNSSKLTKNEGYIIFKVIQKGNSSYLEVGKYSAVHWKDFTGDTVKMSNAYKMDGDKNNGVPTADVAATEYTVANGYYTYYGDYQRQ